MTKSNPVIAVVGATGTSRRRNVKTACRARYRHFERTRIRIVAIGGNEGKVRQSIDHSGRRGDCRTLRNRLRPVFRRRLHEPRELPRALRLLEPLLWTTPVHGGRDPEVPLVVSEVNPTRLEVDFPKVLLPIRTARRWAAMPVLKTASQTRRTSCA
jgi:hypothetical protein